MFQSETLGVVGLKVIVGFMLTASAPIDASPSDKRSATLGVGDVGG